MPTPELKAFDCIDHDPIEEWIPESGAEVDYRSCLHIGQPDREGCDLFYVQVWDQAMEACFPALPRRRDTALVEEIGVIDL